MKTTIIALLAALALTGCGASAAAPAPTVTITEAPTPAPAVTTETVPDVCIQALAAGEAVSAEGGVALGAAAEVIGEIPNLINAILEMDVAEVERITAVTERNTDSLDSEGFEERVTAYTELAEKCRSTT